MTRFPPPVLPLAILRVRFALHSFSAVGSGLIRYGRVVQFFFETRTTLPMNIFDLTNRDRSPSSIEPLESRIAPAFAPIFELSGLSGPNGFQINGQAAGDRAGFSVSDA